MTIVLSVTEMVRDFSGYINRVMYRRERFVLTKGRKAVAEIRPVPGGVKLGELERCLRALPGMPPSEMDAFAADIDAARQQVAPEEARNPWES